MDRSLPYLYAHFIREAEIEIEYSEDFGVKSRRIKNEEEIEHLRHAQKVTGEAVSYACRLIANARPDREGILHHDGAVLSSERVRTLITAFLNDRNFSNSHDSINPHFPALQSSQRLRQAGRADPMALSGASRRKQTPAAFSAKVIRPPPKACPATACVVTAPNEYPTIPM